MNVRFPVLAAGLVTGLAFSLALVSGCAKNSPTAPGISVGTIADLQAAINAAYVPGSVLPTTIDTTASLVAAMSVNGKNAASALFFSNGSLVNAGAVSARTNALGGGTTETGLAEISVNVSGHPQYLYTSLANHPFGIDLPFDGSTFERFTVAGSSAFPAFVDSVRSVARPDVVTPADNATVSRSSSLAVTWSGAFSDTTLYVLVALRSLSDTSRIALGDLVRSDDDATIVPAAKLLTLPAGAARLTVSRYRLDYHNYGGNKVGLAVEATDLRSLTLN